MTSIIPIKKCYYLAVEGSDQGIFRSAFTYFINLGYNSGWIAFNVRENIQNLYKYHKGFESLKKLLKGQEADICGFKICRILDHTVIDDEQMYYQMPEDGKGIPLLAIYPSEGYLQRLNQIPNISSMIVVPWLEREVLGWVLENKAVNLMDNEDEVEKDIPCIDLDQRIKDHIRSELNTINFRRRDWDVYVALKSRDLFAKINEMKIDYEPRAVKYYLAKELKWNILAVDRAYRITKKSRSQNSIS